MSNILNYSFANEGEGTFNFVNVSIEDRLSANLGHFVKSFEI